MASLDPISAARVATPPGTAGSADLVLRNGRIFTGDPARPQAAALAVSAGRFGVSTLRPSEDAPALAHRLGHAKVTRVVVTRSDGTLIGLFFAEDLNP